MISWIFLTWLVVKGSFLGQIKKGVLKGARTLIHLVFIISERILISVNCDLR